MGLIWTGLSRGAVEPDVGHAKSPLENDLEERMVLTSLGPVRWPWVPWVRCSRMRRHFLQRGSRFVTGLLGVLLGIALSGAGSSTTSAAAAPTAGAAIDTAELKVQADAGESGAQEAYALRLEAGHHYSEAAKWYRRAAEAGHAEAQYRLGVLLLTGRAGIDASRPALPAQPRVAIHWLTAASRQDHASAQSQLGRCYQGGVGVGANSVEAYKWFLLAAERDAAARTERDRVALGLSSEQIQKAKSQAAAFRAGDRSDPRIKIVTQAELSATSSSGPPTEAASFAAAELASTEASKLTASPGQASSPPAETNEAPAGATNTVANGEAPAVGNPNPLAGAYRLIFWLVAICGIGGLGLVALVVIVAETRQRRKRAATAGSAPVQNPGPPPLRPSPGTALRTRTGVDRLRTLDQRGLERLMERVFILEGGVINRAGEGAASSSVSFELVLDGVRVAVHCRPWQPAQIGIRDMQEFLGALAAGRFERGILVTPGNYTMAALEFARRNQIEIMDGAHVLARLESEHVRMDPEIQTVWQSGDRGSAQTGVGSNDSFDASLNPGKLVPAAGR